ncbi:hypothetical protein ABZ436_04940 [Micromonospora matsumotoense]|uniref:hypothetical protein n=1 Tax=Micromonospora matsumotoense TaxID=121616 RepID=UPI0033F1CAAF
MGSKKTNTASGTDRVAVQAGQIHGRTDTTKPTAPAADTAPGRTDNVRTGNARVGRQADVITGGLNL